MVLYKYLYSFGMNHAKNIGSIARTREKAAAGLHESRGSLCPPSSLQQVAVEPFSGGPCESATDQSWLLCPVQ